MGELVEVIREFLKAKVLPDLEEPPARFRMQVAVDTSSTLKEERALGKDPATPEPLEDFKARGTELNREVAESLRHGAVPEGAFRLVQQTVADKLEVAASPRYPERCG